MLNIIKVKDMNIEYITLFTTNCYFYKHLYSINEIHYMDSNIFNIKEQNVQYTLYSSIYKLSHLHFTQINPKIQLQYNTVFQSLLNCIYRHYSQFNQYILQNNDDFIYGLCETITSQKKYFIEMANFYFDEKIYENTKHIELSCSIEEIFPHTFFKNRNYNFFFLGWRTSREHFINDCNIIKQLKPECLYIYKVPCRNPQIIDQITQELSSISDLLLENSPLKLYLY
jgi:hypothetical protein